mgnify:CR=1 FL=1
MTATPGISRTAIKLVFLIQAIAAASFLPRIPDLIKSLTETVEGREI